MQFNWKFGIDLSDTSSKSCIWASIGFDFARWFSNAKYKNILGKTFAGADTGITENTEELNKFYQTLAKIKEEQVIKNNHNVISYTLSAGIDVTLSPKHQLFVMGASNMPIH